MNRVFNSKPTDLVSQAFGTWLDNLAPWEWFATFTFRDPDPKPRSRLYTERSGLLYRGRTLELQDQRAWTKIGWKSAHNALQAWKHALVMAMGPSNPAWVACMELQARGVPHWHLLVGCVEDQRPMFWVDWWFERYGIARVLPYDRELGARYYLGKYLTKEIADIQFSPLIYAKTKSGT